MLCVIGAGLPRTATTLGVPVPDELDSDLAGLTHDALRAEVRRLRTAIRVHRDSIGHDLCWHQPDLWDLLPEQGETEVAVPPWPAFLRGCVAYRQSLDEQLPDAPAFRGEYGDHHADAFLPPGAV